MPTQAILSRIGTVRAIFRLGRRHQIDEDRPALNILVEDPTQLPVFVRQSPVAMKYLNLLSPLAWDRFPERQLSRTWLHGRTMPLSAFVAACFIRLDQQMAYMSQLCQYLLDHPALLWLLGFPLTPSSRAPWGFEAEAALPTQRHFSRTLRLLPNDCLQFLLDETVRLLWEELKLPASHGPDEEAVASFGETISLDTKHILAWVKQNNPKVSIKKDRYNKNKQPNGDKDCKLGVKRRRNIRASSQDPPPTPPDNPIPASTISVKEYYWGYGSGVVATRVPGWGEVVLAELTQPFDRPDVSYFFPLMAQVERRLGFRPRYGAFDGAFDAWYVYEYFHRDDQTGGFAAVPFAERGGHRLTFDPEGNPFCQAGLAMPLRYTFISKTSLYDHERGRHVCPLLFPQVTGQACPIEHKQWPKGDCTTTLPTSIGSRIRYQLDRKSREYQQVYNQRTATERINSQAKALGIERPKIRNGQAIKNLNTMIYVLINLRTLHRVRTTKAAAGS